MSQWSSNFKYFNFKRKIIIYYKIIYVMLLLLFILITTILIIIIVLSKTKKNNEGFRTTQKKIKSQYRKMNRDIRYQVKNIYNNISSTGNILFRNFNI